MLLAFSTKPGARLDPDVGGVIMGAGLSGREPGYRLLQDQQVHQDAGLVSPCFPNPSTKDF